MKIFNEENLFILISTICFCILFIEAGPIISIKRFLGFKQEVDSDSRLHNFVRELLYCIQCASYWIGLFIGLHYFPMELANPFAFIVSILSWAIHKQLTK